MIKFIEEDTTIGFREIPDEITLCVNISNCQNNCQGCHSVYLRQNIGSELNFNAVDRLIEKNDGITCFCFMGEGNDAKSLQELILYLKEKYPQIKRALYSGRDVVDEDFYWDNLDYLKIGGFKADCGPLNKKTTNQRLYSYHKVFSSCVVINNIVRIGWRDITKYFYMF